MRLHSSPIVGLTVALAAALPAPVRAQEATTAFVNVSVIPMDRERVIKGQTVVVRGDRIIALGRSKEMPIPAGARRIDGDGKFLMPGLADMHAHPTTLAAVIRGEEAWLADEQGKTETERMLYLYAANGITTIRVMGYFPGDEILAFRARAAKGELVSPRIYAAAGPVDWAASNDSANYFVETAKAVGYDLIKLYGVDGAALDSVVATARRVKLPFAGHVPTQSGLDRALAVGYASIEHLMGFSEYLGSQDSGASGKTAVHPWWSYWEDTTLSPRELVANSTVLRTIAAAMQQAHVWNCPTQAMYETPFPMLNPFGAPAQWPEVRYVSDATRTEWRQQEEQWEKELTVSSRAAIAGTIYARRRIIKALQDAGAGLLLCTDTPARGLLPGFGVHHELEALVRAGLTPYQALTTGTSNVAAYFGTQDSTGTIAVGKRADLVLLDGNPLKDIRHTARPIGVMLGGRWLDRAELDRGLAALEGKLY